MGAEYLAAVSFLPWIPEEPIASFRRIYDPMAWLDLHVTLVFPIPTWEIDRDALREHIRTVVSRTSSFDIRMNTLEKAWDHWLFLVPSEGRDQVIELHDELYTGLLRPFLWTEHPFIPHVGLGLFVVTGDDKDPPVLPRPAGPLDHDRFDHGLREAQALDLDITGPVESVHIVQLDEGPTSLTRLEEIHLRPR